MRKYVENSRNRASLGGEEHLVEGSRRSKFVDRNSFGQMEYREHGPHEALKPGDSRILPLCDLLQIVWARFGRPMIIGETSGLNKGRAA